MPPSRDLGVFVFSYNRGAHLERCLRSVVDNAPARFVRVYDDGSDEPETVRVLRRWASRVDVLRTERGSARHSSRGGLHANMATAFSYARNADVPFALMLQEDMQVVRRIDQTDVDGWRSFFAVSANSVEINVCFDYFDEASPLEWHLDDTGVAFLPNRSIQSDAYSATGLFHVGRYWDRLGELRATEMANCEWLFSMGIVKGRSKAPFTMFMPYPRTSRKRGIRAGAKRWLAEMLANSGVHPFSYMSELEVEQLRQATLDAPPLAREWLRCPTMDHRARWSYFGGARDLRACGGLRAIAGARLGGRSPLHSRTQELANGIGV